MDDKNNTNKPTDDDILESKADILRARGKDVESSVDDADDINIFEDEDLDDSSFEITLDDSSVEDDNSDKTKASAVQPGPEHVVPKLDLSKRILVNERRAASQRRQRSRVNSEKKIVPASAEPKNIIPEADGSMGAIISESKRKRGVEVRQKERQASKKPVAANIKKMPVVELPRRAIKDITVTSEAAIKHRAVPERVNNLQQQIVSEIVARDLAKFCKEI